MERPFLFFLANFRGSKVFYVQLDTFAPERSVGKCDLNSAYTSFHLSTTFSNNNNNNNNRPFRFDCLNQSITVFWFLLVDSFNRIIIRMLLCLNLQYFIVVFINNHQPFVFLFMLSHEINRYHQNFVNFTLDLKLYDEFCSTITFNWKNIWNGQ